MEVILISRLEEKCQLLLKKLEHLKQENERLQLTVTRQQTEFSQQQDRIKEMENSVALLKIAGSATSEEQENPERRKLLRSTINKYIREIDHCIAQLND